MQVLDRAIDTKLKISVCDFLYDHTLKIKIFLHDHDGLRPCQSWK